MGFLQPHHSSLALFTVENMSHSKPGMAGPEPRPPAWGGGQRLYWLLYGTSPAPPRQLVPSCDHIPPRPGASQQVTPPVFPGEGRGPELSERSFQVPGIGVGKTRGGGSWQEEGPQSPPGFLSLPSVFISSLFPEIRMSKPLEAEKQSLDSPSEHTGEGTGRGREVGRCAGTVGNMPFLSLYRH